MDNKLVTKYNGLIEASYRLSLNEARIVLYGISLINPVSKEFPLEFKVDVKRFADMFGLDNHCIYDIVKQAAMDKFWEREFTIPLENGDKMRVRWLNGIQYSDGKGYLKIYMNPLLKPFLHQLGGNYTKYYLDKIAKFKSIYSVRFYEIAIMELNKTKKTKVSFSLKINEIKDRLEIQEKYKRFSNFKAFSLEPAKREINKYSDIKLSYKIKKLGRTPHEIEFTVSKKLQTQQEAFRLPEYRSSKLSTTAFEKALQIVLKSGKRLDIYAIEREFWEYSQKKGQPDNPEGAFMGFVRKKVGDMP